MRKIAMACALAITSCQLLSQTATSVPQAPRPEIRLPAIKRLWKSSGENNKPEITIEEIERCVGQDVDLQREINDIKQRQQKLEFEYGELSVANSDLKRQAEAIASKRTNLQDQFAEFQLAGASLSQRFSAVEQKKNTRPLTQADANAIRAVVGSYNADVAKHNKWRTSLLKNEGSLNQAAEQHGAMVAEANQKIAAFNERNEAFQSLATALTTKSEKYVSACVGERLIKK